MTALAGLANQTQREWRSWWRTQRWWRQALVWTGVTNGLLVGVLWIVPALVGTVDGAGATLSTDLKDNVVQFVQMAAAVAAIGVVIVTQGVVLDERRSGITEWLLSKPLTRPALLLAKLIGQAGGILLSVVLIPWVGVYVIVSVAGGAAWPVAPFLGGVALVALFVVFHVALVLFLSIVPGARGAVLAVPLGLLLFGDLAVSAVPALAEVSPWVVNRLAAALVAGAPVPSVGPAVVTVLAIGVLLGLAAWRFSAEEL